MFKENFIIFDVSRPGERGTPPSNAESRRSLEDETIRRRQIDRAKETIEAKEKAEAKVKRAEKAEEVAVDLIASDISSAVIPEIMEKLLNNEITANGNDVIQSLIEACCKSKKKKENLSTLITLIDSNVIKVENLTNKESIILLSKNLDEKEFQSILNKISENRNTSKQYIENLQFNSELIDSYLLELKKEDRKIQILPTESIKLLYTHINETDSKQAEEFINIFLSNTETITKEILTFIKRELGQKKIDSFLRNLRASKESHNLNSDAVEYFIQNCSNTSLLTSNFTNSNFRTFSAKQLYKIILENKAPKYHSKIIHGMVYTKYLENEDMQASIVIYLIKNDKTNENTLSFIARNDKDASILKKLPDDIAIKYKKLLPPHLQTEGKPNELLNFTNDDIKKKFISELKNNLPPNIEVSSINQSTLKISTTPEIPDFPEFTIKSDFSENLTVNIGKYREAITDEETKTFNKDELGNFVALKSYLDEKLKSITAVANKEDKIEKYLKPNKGLEEKEVEGFSKETKKRKEKWWGESLKEGKNELFNLKEVNKKSREINIKTPLHKSLGQLTAKKEINFQDVMKILSEPLTGYANKQIKKAEEIRPEITKLRRLYEEKKNTAEGKEIRETLTKLIQSYENIKEFINLISTTRRITKKEIKERKEKAEKAKKNPPTTNTSPAINTERYTYTPKGNLIPEIKDLNESQLHEQVKKITPEGFEATLNSDTIIIKTKEESTLPEIKIKKEGDKLNVKINETEKEIQNLSELQIYINQELKKAIQKEIRASALANIEIKKSEGIRAPRDLKTKPKRVEVKSETTEAPADEADAEEKPKEPKTKIIYIPLNKARFEKIKNHKVITAILKSAPFNIEDENIVEKLREICKKSKIDEDIILKIYPIKIPKEEKQLKTSKEVEEYINSLKEKYQEDPNDETLNEIERVFKEYELITALIKEISKARKLKKGEKADEGRIPRSQFEMSEDYNFTEATPIGTEKPKPEGLFRFLDTEHKTELIHELNKLEPKLNENLYFDEGINNTIEIKLKPNTELLDGSFKSTDFKSLKLKTNPNSGKIILTKANNEVVIFDKENIKHPDNGLTKTINDELDKLVESIKHGKEKENILNTENTYSKIDELSKGITLDNKRFQNYNAEKWKEALKNPDLNYIKKALSELDIKEEDMGTVLEDIIKSGWDYKIDFDHILKNDKINKKLNDDLNKTSINVKEGEKTVSKKLIDICFKKENSKIENISDFKEYYEFLVQKHKTKTTEDKTNYLAEIQIMNKFIQDSEFLMTKLSIKTALDSPAMSERIITTEEGKIDSITTPTGDTIRTRKVDGEIQLEFAKKSETDLEFQTLTNVSKEKNIEGKENGFTLVKDDAGEIIYRLKIDKKGKIEEFSTRNITNTDQLGGLNSPIERSNIDNIASIENNLGPTRTIKDGELINYKSNYKDKNISIKKDGENHTVTIEDKEITITGTLEEVSKKTKEIIDEITELELAIKDNTDIKDYKFSFEQDGNTTHTLKYKEQIITFNKSEEQWTLNSPEIKNITINKEGDLKDNIKIALTQVETLQAELSEIKKALPEDILYKENQIENNLIKNITLSYRGEEFKIKIHKESERTKYEYNKVEYEKLEDAISAGKTKTKLDKQQDLVKTSLNQDENYSSYYTRNTTYGFITAKKGKTLEQIHIHLLKNEPQAKESLLTKEEFIKINSKILFEELPAKPGKEKIADETVQLIIFKTEAIFAERPAETEPST